MVRRLIRMRDIIKPGPAHGAVLMRYIVVGEITCPPPDGTSR